MVKGRIGKSKDLPGYWWAECDAVGAYTQGTSREDALVMLADCIEVLSDQPIKIVVTEAGPTDGDVVDVSIDCDDAAALAALVDQRRRR